MHIVFMNPQGNFDPEDSYLTEHPDFGGQLVYVKELAQAMAKRGHNIDIVTRRIRDASWPEFSTAQDSYLGFEENLRILRFSFGGDNFLNKEELWPHIPNLVDKMLEFYGENQPDFITAHYQMADMHEIASESLVYHFPLLAILWCPKTGQLAIKIRIGQLE